VASSRIDRQEAGGEAQQSRMGRGAADLGRSRSWTGRWDLSCGKMGSEAEPILDGSSSNRSWTGTAAIGELLADRERQKSSTKEDEKDSGGYNRNRRRRPGRSSGGGHKNHKPGSDTMLGIDKLYSQRAKGHNI
jgi:hypothetical protein